MRRSSLVALVALIALSGPQGLASASATSSPPVSIGAAGGVLPGGTGALVSIAYRCSTDTVLGVTVTQAATHDGVAQAFGGIAPACDGVRHAARILATVQASIPLHVGAAAIQVQSSRPINVHKVITLTKTSLSVPGFVSSVRRLGSG